MMRGFLIVVGVLASTHLFAADPIPLESFDRLHALISPHEGEDTWATIAWRTQLWEARREAAALGKPILLWEMDGHPLGCT